MSLSPAAPRRRLHTRTVACEGVALQTMGRWKPSSETEKPAFIDGCKAWASDGPVVKRLFPLHYRKTV